MPPVLFCLFFHHHLLHRAHYTCYLWASCMSNPSEQRLLFQCLKSICFFIHSFGSLPVPAWACSSQKRDSSVLLSTLCLFLWGRVSSWSLSSHFLSCVGGSKSQGYSCPCSLWARVTGLCKARVSLCGCWDLTCSLLDYSASTLKRGIVSPAPLLSYSLLYAENLDG